MICKNCVIAGRITADISQHGHEPRSDRLAQIEYWHGRCLAPTTCSCQHRLEQTS